MIDLRSDTVTQPDEAMREAARDAEVGDDVYGEDPTVNELERRAADLVGMEAALYVPTGTMGNQIAVRTHTNRGAELLCERESHVYKWELGGIAQHSGVQARTIDGGERGVVEPEAVHEGYVEHSDHRPGTELLCLENTHNSKGGTAIAADHIDDAAAAAHEHDVAVHLDGARLFNAAVALDVPAERLTREVDSVMFCLSKGLGAPVGSMLAGSEAFVERAHRNRKLFGGGMRQAGIIAAPGLLALENRERLHEDHENAARLAAGLDGIDSLTAHDPETNIVLVDLDEPAASFLERCEDEGVLGVPFDDRQVRFCTHWDVSEEDVEAAVEAVERAV
ncbi:aminotransferase class I/II-fold pyridoxal phosphate-dependent enzyme [Salinirubellus salinus]|uniref:Aminotransferase class I/II-fold pyridoxal phosphate-dependent enzyme n=1 Tax=Salinirubellus salinus TaxID=1364945 RepID=A0A9E7UAG0_9EURY|nr:GntG family PLP-dependent aldolase [Salinirubellus salinus]UWM54002.1 aminotransferase class I/II-fold pyridoxal phosphate-dependent enzyme [Salinirubellus salinus]